MRHGEVWWAHFDEQRPVVLLSENPPDDGRRPEAGMRAIQIVAPSGVNVAGLGLEVTLGTDDGLSFDGVVRVAFPRPGFVPCTWLTRVAIGDLVERIGVLSPAKLTEIDEALAKGELVPGAEDSEQDAASTRLAAIRQSLRLGAMTTRQIRRGPDTRATRKVVRTGQVPVLLVLGRPMRA